MSKLLHYALITFSILALPHLSYTQMESGSPEACPQIGKCYCFIPDPLRMNTGMTSIAYQGEMTAARCGLICKTGKWDGGSRECSQKW